METDRTRYDELKAMRQVECELLDLLRAATTPHSGEPEQLGSGMWGQEATSVKGNVGSGMSLAQRGELEALLVDTRDTITGLLLPTAHAAATTATGAFPYNP